MDDPRRFPYVRPKSPPLERYVGIPDPQKRICRPFLIEDAEHDDPAGLDLAVRTTERRTGFATREHLL